jgi:SAM-dependent methyltransferase
VDYDEMINFENSLKNKIIALKDFCSPNDKLALDLGCGTGVDAIALSKLGMVVDAIDHSKGMLEQAVKNSKRVNSKINFYQASLTDFYLDNRIYDVIISFGNTIANLNPIELKMLMHRLYDHLNESGQIIFQMINYKSLPASGPYLLNSFQNDSISIIRKYNINAQDIDFIIEKVDKVEGVESRIATKLYPHSENNFKQLAAETGFRLISYGNLNKATFIEKKSNNLVTILKKTT